MDFYFDYRHLRGIGRERWYQNSSGRSPDSQYRLGESAERKAPRCCGLYWGFREPLEQLKNIKRDRNRILKRWADGGDERVEGDRVLRKFRREYGISMWVYNRRWKLKYETIVDSGTILNLMYSRKFSVHSEDLQEEMPVHLLRWCSISWEEIVLPTWTWTRRKDRNCWI